MKLVLAEKHSVALVLASFLGATSKKTGYYEGNGYQVSWARGHLVDIGQAKDYDPTFEKWSNIPLPYFPQFMLFPKKQKDLQLLLDINTRLLKNATEVINATDAEREGELIFRYIYEISGVNRPVQRLWLSSLTHDAIKNAFSNITSGDHYNNLFQAAKARNHADWIVGINATTSLSLKTGNYYSVGRVQTPVLKLIVDRTKQNRDFKSEPFYHLSLEISEGVKALSTERFDSTTDPTDLERIIEGLENSCFVEEKSLTENTLPPPKLYSLSALQVDANKKYGFNAEMTLSLAQELYQDKLITYPRTDSQYLSNDMNSSASDIFSKYCYLADVNYDASKLLPSNQNVFNDEKVSDHHAIIPTMISSKDLSDDKMKIFGLVVMRFLASFAMDAKRNNVSFILKNQDRQFQYSYNHYTEPGWMLIYKSEESLNNGFIELNKGQTINCKPDIHSGKTHPKPLYTDATLILSMNAAGKDLEDETQLEAMKGKGLGTPATQAGIIEKLIKVDYIKRKGKSIHSTEKGEKLISELDNIKSNITSVELTAAWESRLMSVQNGEMNFQDFINGIKEYTTELLTNFNSLKIDYKEKISKPLGVCPKCNKGSVKGSKNGYYCSRFNDKEDKCNFFVYKKFRNRTITESLLKEILEKKKTKALKFKSKKGEDYEARLILKEDCTVATLSML